MVNIIIFFIAYIIISLIAALVFGIVLVGLLYCICWIVAFIDDFQLHISKTSCKELRVI